MSSRMTSNCPLAVIEDPSRDRHWTLKMLNLKLLGPTLSGKIPGLTRLRGVSF